MRKNVAAYRGFLFALFVLLVAFFGFLYVAYLKGSFGYKAPGVSIIEDARRKAELARSQKQVHFFSSVKGLTLRPGSNSSELEKVLLDSKIFGQKIVLADLQQNSGSFEVQRVIFELVDVRQPYYEQQFPSESAPHQSFGLTKYDEKTLLVKIYFSPDIYQELNGSDLSWMFYTRAQEILRIWEYRERFGSITDYVPQQQEDAARIQAKATEVSNTQGVEGFPVVVVKAGE